MARSKPLPRGERRLVRCAVYTRKSTEEGLDQAFNSLDAQREACEAYILSQRQEGWTLLSGRYDDGGFSGGNMARPGLQRLLADVQAGRVDVIVVYKVDRLTRALSDFAKIVETLDKVGASFVSITQSFNTTSSMGRLTLNVLLSFAQFEREVISERVRDKVAASKAKGMWMGGVVPLGYDARDRKLVINEAEAGTVRHIFLRYLELGSVRSLMADLAESGVVTKRQLMRDGSVRGEVAWDRGPLYHFLKNPIYIGRIPHHAQSYSGEHQGIVDPELFEAVQAKLAANAADRKAGRTAANPSLLTGMIRDSHDRPLSPSHAQRGAKRYRYYVSGPAPSGSDDQSSAAPILRMRATDLEQAAIAALTTLLRDEALVADWTTMRSTEMRDLRHRRDRMIERIAGRRTADLREELLAIDYQLWVEPEQILASCCRRRLLDRLGASCSDAATGIRLSATLPVSLRQQGHEMRLVLDAQPLEIRNRNPHLIALLTRASIARDQLATMPFEKTPEARLVRRNLTRVARLSYLAPDIVQAIVGGRQPEELGARSLLRISDPPISWTEQRRILGFE